MKKLKVEIIKGNYWYESLVGSVLEVVEQIDNDVRVKFEGGNIINSQWIYEGDYKSV